MKGLLKKIFTTAACLLLAPLAWAQGEGIVVDKIIAKVNDYIILKSELEVAYRQYLESQQVPRSDTYCNLLRELLIGKMMVAKAEIDSVMVDDDQVEGQLSRRMDVFISQFGTAQKIEAAYGKSIAQLRDELRPTIKEQLVAQKMQGTITEDVKITPRDVKRYFNSIPTDSLPEIPDEYEVGIIVKFPQISRSEKDKAKTRLLEYKRQVLSGDASFEDLATAHSQDLGSASRGGNLGFQSRGDLVPPYEAAALALEAGQISDPVESEFGIHLIQLIERRGNRYNSRHILLRPEATTDDLQTAEKQLDSIRTLIVDKKTSFEKAANDFSDDKMTKVQGGLLKSNETGDIKLSKEELELTIALTLDTMSVGGVTKPMQFRSDDGKTGTRIIWFKNHLKAHPANLKDDYQKIQGAALNRERMRILGQWFDRTKSQLFIDIDRDYQDCRLLESLY